MDSAVAGRRLRDVRNGFSLPFKLTLAKILRLATHPTRALRMARAGSPKLKVMAAELGQHSSRQREEPLNICVSRIGESIVSVGERSIFISKSGGDE
ncbi:alpha-hydroxy-acid oxidizing protein [Mesorhizobium sp. B1-1-5]|uniref:alpha-hydroxy-acid oxidizing protein n=1 Tax=Mesorhizobium sp. B1-1-5 TaxID=2589979 RepID=UPI001126AD9A|nr:alpha-hydroxy-acid oxidizing protein [Mesorhizobium sp. B1-1-5]TPO13749.1 alpha-hydroxy-acid oxidizing protein [Mesorhizobium sp. B1-1-5]